MRRSCLSHSWPALSQITEKGSAGAAGLGKMWERGRKRGRAGREGDLSKDGRAAEDNGQRLLLDNRGRSPGVRLELGNHLQAIPF